MLYTCKKNGVRAAVHTRSGKTHLLDSLTYDMLGQFLDSTDLPEELPMGTRYFFAKYDSGDLKRSYAIVREIIGAEMSPCAAADTVTGAVLTPAVLGERYGEILRTLPADASLLLSVSAGEDVDAYLALAREWVPAGRITLRAPLELCHGADGYQVVVGDITAFAGAALPENSVVLTTFAGDTDLSAEVTRLLNAGYAVCAVPAVGMDPDAAVKAYDGLSRTLTRRKRTDTTFRFLPFMLGDMTGRWLLEGEPVEADLDSLPGAFWQYGAQMPLAGCISAPAILRSLVESAIVLEQA